MPPPSAHAHWHIDVSYLNLSGTFYKGEPRFILDNEFLHGITAGNIDADIS